MKKWVCWLLAIIITLTLSIYQRRTGPTNPKRVTVELSGESYPLKLPRTGVRNDEIVELKGVPSHAGAQLHYRRYPTSDEYTTVDFNWKDDVWQAALPVQPVAGKLQYYITVGGSRYPAEDPVVIRFRNDVPAGILIPHIIFMFAAMLFAVYTLLLALTRKKYSTWLVITTTTLFVGGFILGPLVQHVAFGPWWTGFPFGSDLTDNKTLISFLFFIAALATLKWKHNKWVVALAVLVMLAIFSIPHSTRGSEYDYTREQPGKTALLMVHFGTTYDETRTRTIEAINAKAQASFPDMAFREAYTSRIVIRKLRGRGIEKQTPLEALQQLHAEGFTRVIIQSTTLLEGAEMESLRRDAASEEASFQEIRVGAPLLYDVADCQKVVDILAARHAAEADTRQKAHVVLVGHGTYTPATATYSQIDYMFSAQGHPLFHVGTLEGYPTYETMLDRLNEAKARRVTLVPLLFVAGDHASNDIAVDWKETLEAEGLQVDCHLEGLGEIPEIQDIYIEHIRYSLDHVPVDIMKLKEAYAAGKE